MSKVILILTIYSVLFTGLARSPEQQSLSELQQQVADTERAFAETMAQVSFSTGSRQSRLK